MDESGMGDLVPVSRRAERTCDLARSRGPISNRSGTPCLDISYME